MFDSFTDLSCEHAGTGCFIDRLTTQVASLAAKLQKLMLLRIVATPDKSYECCAPFWQRLINMTQHRGETTSIPIRHFAAEQRSFPNPQLEIGSRVIPMTQFGDGSKSIPMPQVGNEQRSIPLTQSADGQSSVPVA